MVIEEAPIDLVTTLLVRHGLKRVRNGLKRVPVLGSGKVVGIVSRADILVGLAQSPQMPGSGLTERQPMPGRP
jgi:signal-transduction protein with cAMP-binding, CBS, and nucleotidyltransferase domain